MDWRGIEWVLPLYKLAMLVLPVYGFLTLRRRVKHGLLGKARAFWYYAGLVVSPVLGYILLFFVLIGLEEVSRIGVLTEGLARSFIMVIGLGLMIWVVSSITFGVALAFVKGRASPPAPRTDCTP